MATADKTMYYIVTPSSFAYNPARINVGSIGYYNGSENVIVSSLYEVFQTTDEINDRFLWHWFKNEKFQKLIEQYQEGGVRLYFYYDKLCMGSISTPKVEEQRRIGAYFDDLDRLITLHQRKYDKLTKVKKAMLEKMFPENGSLYPEIRFKGFTDAWEQRKLSDTLNSLSNNTLSRAELSEDTGTYKNVHYGDVLVKFGEYIDAQSTDLPYIADDEKAKKFESSKLQDGDIIIADTAEDEAVGKCVEIGNIGDLSIVSGLHTIPCRSKVKFAPAYLGFYLNSSSYHDQLIPLMQGIKVTSISKSAISDTLISAPTDLSEQGKIGQFFSQLDTLITLHQRKPFC
ncbi:restriction endonuclease subunit S [Ruminococcus sp.]|uniref:restriction endonuclease subunit S n=1 Tax=Ruminococcus sp. TaxID=41978 RepID=UPI0025FBAD63|nr:restriction endonuclease subunit S [Ruminococcus sp.]